MLERFTKQAREAVAHARLEADAVDSRTVALPFLLLGVLETADGITAAVLRDAGFDAGELRKQMQAPHELGDKDAQALKSIGIDLDAVRARLRDTFGEDALREPAADQPTGLLGWLTSGHGHARFTDESKKALELALRHAIARKENHIGAEHVLLGVLTCAESHEATRTLIEAKLPVRELKAQLLTAMDAAA